MTFWDASAVIPLLVTEPTSPWLRSFIVRDPTMFIWWGTKVECVSAIARLESERALDGATVRAAYRTLDDLATGWREIDPTDRLREIALRFLRVHALRAGDAFQLAAAFLAAEWAPASLPVITLDQRLHEAAAKEGFALVDPGAA